VINYLIRSYGWRAAIESIGILTMIVLFPVGIWITRSAPAEMGLFLDGSPEKDVSLEAAASSFATAAAVRTANFWYILLGSALVIGAIGAVIQHFILFLKDLGYSTQTASRFLSILLACSLCGRVVVGYLVDKFSKKNTMAFFYLLIGLLTLLLGVSHQAVAIWTFAIIFGFSMGADYMLIPLVTAECFGTEALGKVLALIIMGYSLGQWGAPWVIGKLFDAQHSYALGWKIMAVAAMIGAAAVYRVSASARES
jgi:MFS family permease